MQYVIELQEQNFISVFLTTQQPQVCK